MWNIKYKNIELLFCISETNIILQVNYISIKNLKNEKILKKKSGHLPTLTAKNYTQPSLLLWVPRWLSRWRIHLPCRRHRRCGFDPWVGKMPWKRKWQFTPVLLPEKAHGQRSLSGYSPTGRRHDWANKRRTSLLVMTPWGRQDKTYQWFSYLFISLYSTNFQNELRQNKKVQNQ